MKLKFKKALFYSSLLIIFCQCNKNYKIEKHVLGNGVKVVSKSHKDSANIQHVKVYYENGELEKQFKLINDLESGAETVFYKSSNIKSSNNYIDGDLNGEQKEYFDSEQILVKEILNYEFGRRIGNQYEFYKNNKIKRHIIISPKHEVCNEITYDEKGIKTYLNKLKFKPFGDFDKDTYKAGDTINYRAFIFNPIKYNIKYSSSFYASEQNPIKPTPKKIIKNKVNQNFILTDSKSFTLEEEIEIYDIVNDTVFFENYSLKITPNNQFY